MLWACVLASVRAYAQHGLLNLICYLRLRRYSRFQITQFDVSFDLFTTFQISHHRQPTTHTQRRRSFSSPSICSNSIWTTDHCAETMSGWLKCRSHAFEDAFSLFMQFNHNMMIWLSSSPSDDKHTRFLMVCCLSLIGAIVWWWWLCVCLLESFHFENDTCNCSIASFSLLFLGTIAANVLARSHSFPL